MFTISLFGTFDIARDGATITHFRSDRVRALLAYLVLEAERPHRREVLATLLWPDQPDHGARLNLRQVLFRLRQALDAAGAAATLHVTPREVRFQMGTDTWVDARAFDALLGAIARHAHPETGYCKNCIAHLHKVVDLYKGPFLAGLSPPDSEPFRDWLIPTQERFHHQALRALWILAEHYLLDAAYDLAEQYAQRQIALEPWRETAHQQVMRALALRGQRNMALAQYRRCVAVLAEQLGVEPDPTTTELAEQIRRGALPVRATGSAVERRYALPLPLSPFFGRQRELAHLDRWLRAPQQRLVTLVGPGGIGKTRLALEAARAQSEHFAHGACLVPLGTSESLPSLIPAIAAALDLSLQGRLSAKQQLSDFLADKSLLLLLDGGEAVPGAAPLLVDLLASAPGLKLLITSRTRLDLVGEWVLAVEGFAVPEPPSPAFGQVPAVQLFLLRAQQVLPTFDPGARDREAILNICRLVGGVPLAIELAAGWLRALTCPAIEAELSQSASFLLAPSEGADAPTTLEPLFHHSWRLLAPTEKQVFRQLAVFPGSFDRHAAHEVAGASLRDLLHLIDHSFLRSSGPDRYAAHELVRQYGLVRLSEVSHELVATRNRHAAYYSAFLAARVAALRGQNQRAALEEIGEEIENVRAAWEWSVTRLRLVELEGSLDGLFHFYDIRSWFEEGHARFRAARLALEAWLGAHAAGGRDEAHQEVTRLCGKALAREGWFAFHLGDDAGALATLQRSLDLLREAGVERDMVFSLNYLAAVTYHLGSYERANRLCAEGRMIAEAAGDDHGLAIANNISGQIAFVQGNYQAAEAYSRASLAIERALGNRWSMAFSLYNLGNVAYAEGRYAEAEAQFQASLTIRQELGDLRGTALCYNRLAETVEASGDPVLAQARFAESLAIFRSIGDRRGMMATHVSLGRVAVTLDQLDDAQVHLTAALGQSPARGASPVMLAALAQWARLQWQRGEAERAVELLYFVREQPATTRETQDDLERLLAQVTPDLPMPTVQQLREVGRGLSLEDVVREITGKIGDQRRA